MIEGTFTGEEDEVATKGVVRIVIFGSCVSRDILNYDVNHAFDLAAYYARSSFASAFTLPPTVDVYSANLSSKFQAAIIKADLEKTLLDKIDELRFDIFLIDLIDERFNVFSAGSGGIFTVSNELRSAGFDEENEPGRLILSGSEEYFALWETGWERFVSLMSAAGNLSKVVVNRTLWSAKTKSGRDFGSAFNPAYIRESNMFLLRLYERMGRDLAPNQFLQPPVELVYGNEEHRWGLSPFHYVDDFYLFLLDKLSSYLPNKGSMLRSGLKAAGAIHPDRELDTAVLFSNSASFVGTIPFDQKRFKGNASSTRIEDGMKFTFSGPESNYQIRFALPEPLSANGLSVRMKLSGWDSLGSVSLGYGEGPKFIGVTSFNPKTERWVCFTFAHSDMLFEIYNKSDNLQSGCISEIRIYLRGAPSPNGAALKVESISVWSEKPFSALEYLQKQGCEREYSPLLSTLPALGERLYEYLSARFPHATLQTKSFFDKGTCLLDEGVSLPWSPMTRLPENVGSQKHLVSWHSFHHATILMLHAIDTNDFSAVMSAREFVNDWLNHSFKHRSEKDHIIWQSQVAGERLLSLLMLWNCGVSHKFDRRFMIRLHHCIFEHARFLSSDITYFSKHEDTFACLLSLLTQSVALYLVSFTMKHWQSSDYWRKISLERIIELSSAEKFDSYCFGSEQSQSASYIRQLVALADQLGDIGLKS
ncbi:DUF6270 domain-containing protein [Pseudomonas sp. Sample_24]|uniref:DUF6270 domain-containing protein n=1 Tax=Pseudomonas sp. Sample_24 TaxID=2448268 RepID=UPI001032C636|nr:DUF6270 domain-containing protein [Pseudomonas sp. Sample_24]